MTGTVRDEALIHAFLDGQLSHREREAFLRDLEQDPRLQAEYNQLRHLKDLVRHAYDGVEAPARQIVDTNHPRKRLVGFGMAAAMLLALGFTGGWLSHQPSAPTTMQLAAANHEQEPRVILHIASADPSKMEETLNNAEEVFRTYRDRGVQVEVVANSEGLNLLRAGVSPYSERVVEMMATYDNLHFVACNTAIARLQRSGAQVVLIPQTHTAPSAVEHIVQRIREGWTYIKV